MALSYVLKAGRAPNRMWNEFYTRKQDPYDYWMIVAGLVFVLVTALVSLWAALYSQFPNTVPSCPWFRFPT